MGNGSLHFDVSFGGSPNIETACGFEKRKYELKTLEGEGFSFAASRFIKNVTCDHCLLEVRLRQQPATIGDIQVIVNSTHMAEDEEFWARMKKIVREAIDEDEAENEAEYGRWHEERVMQSLDDFFTANLAAFKDLIKLSINENYLDVYARSPKKLKKSTKDLRDEAIAKSEIVMHFKLSGGLVQCGQLVGPNEDMSLSKGAVTCEACLAELAKD